MSLAIKLLIGIFIMKNIIIRQENPSEFELITNIIKTAFESAPHTDGDEHNLVIRLRNSDAFIPELALVAEINDEVVGHILFSKIVINGTTQIALAPVSVLPEFQKCGVGSALINRGHEIAKEMGFGYSIVLGSNEYYPKFGYEIAEAYGIKAPFEVPSEYFMALKLNENAPDITGTVEYAKEFGI